MIISKIQAEFEKEGYEAILTEVVDPGRPEKSPFHILSLIDHFSLNSYGMCITINKIEVV